MLHLFKSYQLACRRLASRISAKYAANIEEFFYLISVLVVFLSIFTMQSFVLSNAKTATSIVLFLSLLEIILVILFLYVCFRFVRAAYRNLAL